MPTNAWLGLTLGKVSMNNVDMLVFQAQQDGSVKVTDFYGIGYGYPLIDSQQDWKYLGRKN